MNECMDLLKYTQLFFICATHLERGHWRHYRNQSFWFVKQVLYLGNDISENLAPKFPSKSAAISRTPLPACPRKCTPPWYIFSALPAVSKNLGRTLTASHLPWSNDGRKVWATVLFLSAIIPGKSCMSNFCVFLPFLQSMRLLRSRNFATMATRRNDFPSPLAETGLWVQFVPKGWIRLGPRDQL